MAVGDVNPFVPPAWLEAALDQRIAKMAEGTGLHRTNYNPDDKTMVATTLTEPAEGQDYAEWDRQCDNCKRVVPGDEVLHAGRCVREFANGQPIVITFGMCTTCKELP